MFIKNDKLIVTLTLLHGACSESGDLLLPTTGKREVTYEMLVPFKVDQKLNPMG